MYDHHIYQSMNQSVHVANPACGQLNRENEYFPIPVRRAREFGLARRVLPFHPVSSCSSPLSRNLVFTHGIPPAFSGGAHIFVPPTVIGPILSFYRVTQLRTDGVYCRKAAGAGPVVFKVVPVTRAAILQVTMDQLICASLFPTPTSN